MAWLMEDCLRRVGSARTLRAHCRQRRFGAKLTKQIVDKSFERICQLLQRKSFRWCSMYNEG